MPSFPIRRPPPPRSTPVDSDTSDDDDDDPGAIAAPRLWVADSDDREDGELPAASRRADATAEPGEIATTTRRQKIALDVAERVVSGSFYAGDADLDARSRAVLSGATRDVDDLPPAARRRVDRASGPKLLSILRTRWPDAELLVEEDAGFVPAGDARDPLPAV